MEEEVEVVVDACTDYFASAFTSIGSKRKASEANMNNIIPISDFYYQIKEPNLCLRLFDLPVVLFHVIFEYLDDPDLVRFDLAVCNHKDRDRYLSLLKGMTISTGSYIYEQGKLEWLQQRQIRLHSVCFGINIDEDELDYIDWSCIKKWSFDFGPLLSVETILDYLSKCTSLEKLTLDYDLDDVDDDNDHYFFGPDRNLNEIVDEEYAETMLSIFDNPDFCSRLKILSVKCSLFSGNKALKAISQHCHNLVQIHLGDSQINGDIKADTMLQFFSRCGANLESLDFKYIHNFGVKFCLQVIKYCPRLTTIHLNLSSGAIMKKIAQCCPKLLTLHLDAINDDNGLVDIFESCRQLQNLSIKSSKVSDCTMVRAFECWHNLRSVSLDSVTITVRALEGLARNCKQLEELSLVSLVIPTSDLVRFSARSTFANLRSLSCTKLSINDQCLLEFARKSPFLNKLEIDNCKYISDVGMYHIASHCRNLSTLRLKNLPGVYSPDNLIDILKKNKRILYSYFSFSGDNAPLICVGKYDYTPKLRALLKSRSY